MKYKVTKKQHNGRMCLVCGLENKLGLKTRFYELENGEVTGLFSGIDEHQSYPGRMHGGIIGAALDETIGRAIMIKSPEVWGVTLELSIQYKKPIPLNQKLKAIGRITKDSSRIFEGTGEIILENGDIAAIAHGRYLKMSLEKITGSEFGDDEWQVIPEKMDPKEI